MSLVLNEILPFPFWSACIKISSDTHEKKTFIVLKPFLVSVTPQPAAGLGFSLSRTLPATSSHATPSILRNRRHRHGQDNVVCFPPNVSTSPNADLFESRHVNQLVSAIAQKAVLLSDSARKRASNAALSHVLSEASTPLAGTISPFEFGTLWGLARNIETVIPLFQRLPQMGSLRSLGMWSGGTIVWGSFFRFSFFGKRLFFN